MKAWLAKHQDEIEVFYLPSYSPELNPDEMLNADLKQAVTTKAPARTKGQLLKATTSHMRKLQKSPARVKNYFEHALVSLRLKFNNLLPDQYYKHADFDFLQFDVL